MMNMDSGFVPGGKTCFLLQPLPLYLVLAVEDERGMQACCFPTIHCLCSCVCKTRPPEARSACASHDQRGSWAQLAHLWGLTHTPRGSGTKRGLSEEVAGRGAAVASPVAGAPGSNAAD